MTHNHWSCLHHTIANLVYKSNNYGHYGLWYLVSGVYKPAYTWRGPPWRNVAGGIDPS